MTTLYANPSSSLDLVASRKVGLEADRFHSMLATFLTICGHTPIPWLGPLQRRSTPVLLQAPACGVSEVGLEADRFHNVLTTFLMICGHTPIP